MVGHLWVQVRTFAVFVVLRSLTRVLSLISISLIAWQEWVSGDFRLTPAGLHPLKGQEHACVRSPRGLTGYLILLVLAQIIRNLPANAGDPGFIHGSRKSPWRQEWQPTPVFLPGESHGQRSPEGYSPWGRKE